MLTEQQADYWTRRLPRTYEKEPPVNLEFSKISFNKSIIERAIAEAEAIERKKRKRFIPNEVGITRGEIAIERAAAFFNYHPDTLMVPNRSKNIVRARLLAIYVFMKVTGLGYSPTARRFGKDHSTIIHAMKKIGKSPVLQKIGDQISNEILSMK